MGCAVWPDARLDARGMGGSCGGTLKEGAEQRVLLSKRTLGDLRMGWTMADAWRGTSLSNFRFMNISCACVMFPERIRRRRVCSVFCRAGACQSSA